MKRRQQLKFASGRMWRGGNRNRPGALSGGLRRLATRGRWAGVWALGLVLLLGMGAGGCPGAQAQSLRRPVNRQMQAPADAPKVDGSDARRAFQLAENACIAGQVSLAKSPTDEDYLWVTDLGGVRVTLRWDGVVMGVGDAFVPDRDLALMADPTGRKTPVVDLYVLTRRATDQALKAAAETLGDIQRKRALEGQTSKPGTHTETLVDIGNRLAVDLQVARWPRPVILAAEAGPGAIYGTFAPDYQGLVMWRTEPDPAHPHRTQTLRAWDWPASALAGNVPPQDQLIQMLVALGYPLTDLPRIAVVAVPKPGQSAAPQLARFQVIHVVRPARTLPPMQLERGNAVLPPAAVDERALEPIAVRLTDFLTRRQRPDGTMAGTYLASADRYDPVTASDADLALAALALERRANLLSANAPGHKQLGQCRADVRKAMDALLGVGAHHPAPDLSPAASALVVMTLVEAPDLAQFKTQRDALVQKLLALREPQGGFRTTFTLPAKGAKLALANIPTQCLILAALAQAYEQTRDSRIKEVLEPALDALWQDHPPNQLVIGLPWLAMAQMRLAALERADGVDAARQKELARRDEILMAMAQALRGKIVESPPDFGPADVVGGMDFTRLGPDAPPNPDWRTAQFLVFLSRMLQEPQVNQGRDRYQWLLDCGLGARFIQQLMFDQVNGFYLRSASDAMGGVRLSMWDNRTAIGPSAMALLAIDELQSSLVMLGGK